MLKSPWLVNLSELIIKKSPSSCSLYRNSKIFQLFPLFSHLSPVRFYFCQVAWAAVGAECPPALCSDPWLSAGREARSFAPSLCRHRAFCHGPASRACESSASREGLLHIIIADLGSQPCSNQTLAGCLPQKQHCGPGCWGSVSEPLRRGVTGVQSRSWSSLYLWQSQQIHACCMKLSAVASYPCWHCYGLWWASLQGPGRSAGKLSEWSIPS